MPRGGSRPDDLDYGLPVAVDPSRFGGARPEAVRGGRMRSGAKQAVVIAGAGAAVAVAVKVADPEVRAEFRRLRQFGRPLDNAAGGPPVPPPLPPGRIVPVAGVGELFVRDSGGAGRPAVLLLHGWGATADANFFTTYPALVDAYRVVAVDHRGHGRGLRAAAPFTLEDCADDAAALLSELGIDRAVLVGYSMGGPVALLMAHRHPERVAGLVLEATALEFNAGLRERVVWRGLTVLEAALRHGAGDGVVQRVLREAIDRQPALVPYRAWIAGEFRRGHVTEIVEAGRALSRFDARRFVAAIDQPAAAIVTSKDRLVPPRKQRELAAALNAITFELRGDHDAPIIEDAFGPLTHAAVDHVATRAGLMTIQPADDRVTDLTADAIRPVRQVWR